MDPLLSHKHSQPAAATSPGSLPAPSPRPDSPPSRLRSARPQPLPQHSSDLSALSSQRMENLIEQGCPPPPATATAPTITPASDLPRVPKPTYHALLKQKAHKGKSSNQRPKSTGTRRRRGSPGLLVSCCLFVCLFVFENRSPTLRCWSLTGLLSMRGPTWRFCKEFALFSSNNEGPAAV